MSAATLSQIGGTLRQMAFDCTQTTNATFPGRCVVPTTVRAAKRLSVQAGRCRCSRDPAAPFDRVASSPPRRIGDGDIVRGSDLRIRFALAANVRNEKSILRPSIRHQNERFS
jgi:hypothetical protein